VVEELDHLPADLQLAQVAVKVEAVRAVDGQLHVHVQHVVHRDRHRPLDPGRHGNLRDVAYERRMRLPARKRHAEPGNLGGIRRSLSGQPPDYQESLHVIGQTRR
jgi:hypothetical protein